MPSSDKESGSNKSKIDTGRLYENQAALFYEREGYEILERNWRSGRKEIDLIVRNDRLLVFVEVKASLGNQYGHPSERVDRRKQAHLTEAAQRFITERDISGVDMRFDVVTFSSGKLEHFPGAFEATD